MRLAVTRTEGEVFVTLYVDRPGTAGEIVELTPDQARDVADWLKDVADAIDLDVGPG